ncbi:MAG: pentapeptide repeat-containing protein [Cyanobacteria bacterium P01_D01_bin.50]
MDMVGSGEEITGEELLRRYKKGERDFPLINLYDEKCILQEADLKGINMVAGYFLGGSFYKTNLSEACLIGFDSNCLGLEEANFSNANLSRACLWSSILDDADLSRCNLEGANLRNAHLWNANLFNASLDGAVLANTDFTNAKHFEIHRYMTGILFWNTIMPDGSVLEGPIYIN